MSNIILLSIKPEYANKILNGSKKYEFRRKIPKNKISKIVIYSTSPDKVILGEVEVVEVISLNKYDLWELTHIDAGIEKVKFLEYFKDIEIANAFKLGVFRRYNQHKHLSEYNIMTAPQSFVYLND